MIRRCDFVFCNLVNNCIQPDSLRESGHIHTVHANSDAESENRHVLIGVRFAAMVTVKAEKTRLKE